MLPLFGVSGKPVWFVTTSRIVSASEVLCEGALLSDPAFDPYRFEMTTDLSAALSQEAYFTSYVEGADFPLNEAVDFLRRGSDPENIYEQNILNNHQAWSYLLGSLTMPFGEKLVKDLAFYLTEGQNDGTIDYRHSDSADIPALAGERYSVPLAASIPDRMNQFFQFLSDPSIHPLVKAPVAQAWAFSVRPFPEANERLARMLSSAVLLRSVYEYFLNISVSASIAHESYCYFKAMKDSIRPESEGDYTYFLEYYLQLLVRALKANKESRQQQLIDAERQMAMQPLAPSPPAASVNHQDYITPLNGVSSTNARSAVNSAVGSTANPSQPSVDINGHTDLDTLISGAVPLADMDASTGSPTIPTTGSLTRPTTGAVPDPQQENKLSCIVPIDNIETKIQSLLDLGMSRFTHFEWSDINLVSNRKAVDECTLLYRSGLADRYIQDGRYFYLLRFNNMDECEALVLNGIIINPFTSPIPENPDFWAEIAKLESGTSSVNRSSAIAVRDMISEGIREFSMTQFMDRTGFSREQFGKAYKTLYAHNIIVRVDSNGDFSVRRTGHYKFTNKSFDSAVSLDNNQSVNTNQSVDNRNQSVNTYQSEESVMKHRNNVNIYLSSILCLD